MDGNVKVSRNGAITISGRTYIKGNVQSEEGGRYVRIAGPGVTIGGNVQIKYAWEASSIQSGVQIRGNLQYVENPGFLNVSEAFIRGDLQPFKNTGGSLLTDNTTGRVAAPFEKRIRACVEIGFERYTVTSSSTIALPCLIRPGSSTAA